MRVETVRLSNDTAGITIAGAQYVSMTAGCYPSGTYTELSLHLTSEQCCELCNAIRSLRDADHDAANEAHADRLAMLAEQQAAAERIASARAVGGETS
jgi:hypothetical protein